MRQFHILGVIILMSANIPKGWNIVTYNGINLGFIKNIGSRVNNYFPVEWRIRLDASAMQTGKSDILALN